MKKTETRQVGQLSNTQNHGYDRRFYGFGNEPKNGTEESHDIDLGPNFFNITLPNLGFNFQQAMWENVDNSAGRKSGNASEIRITVPTELGQPYVFWDNGIGRTKDDLVKSFNIGSTSSGHSDIDTPGKFGTGEQAAYSKLGAIVVIKTRAKGTNNVVTLEWSTSNRQYTTSFRRADSNDAPHWTEVRIYPGKDDKKLELLRSTGIAEIRRNLSAKYFHLKKYGVSIKLNGEEIRYADPLYRDKVKPNHIIKKTAKIEIGKKTHNLPIIFSVIKGQEHNKNSYDWIRDNDKSGFEERKQGIYMKLGITYTMLGGAWFSRGMHNRYNGVRAEVDVPNKELAEIIGLSLNKSLNSLNSVMYKEGRKFEGQLGDFLNKISDGIREAEEIISKSKRAIPHKEVMSKESTRLGKAVLTILKKTGIYEEYVNMKGLPSSIRFYLVKNVAGGFGIKLQTDGTFLISVKGEFYRRNMHLSYTKSGERNAAVIQKVIETMSLLEAGLTVSEINKHWNRMEKYHRLM